ncbi:SDR family oxidoreductase [Streptomyces sp. NPDC086554]|uniref:SDR family oxidoreductase n=1 Tax=Streptomyces sp. NPDC086554 TaxID=3154864 RepID=UPI0034327A32
MNTRPTVLLTGASGVVGRSILQEAGDGVRIVAASHSSPVTEAAATQVQCDLTAHHFGLDEDAYAALADEVDVVIHSAGLTEWGLPEASYQPVNVEGTRRVIEFARQAGAVVHFISTAFVAALMDNAPRPLGEDNVCRNYIASKLKAEQLLRDSGLPHVMYRPTNLIGDSVTGWTTRGQIVQLMSDWIGRGKAPFLAVHDGIRMDFVPHDLLSKAVLGAIEQGDDEGEFWVTLGSEAMGLTACLDVMVKHAASRGRTLEHPPVVDADTLDPEAIARTSPMSRSYLSVLRDTSEVTRCSGGVLPTSMPELRRRYGIAQIDDSAAYLTSLEYAAAHLS